jgi:5'-3' exonuclease
MYGSGIKFDNLYMDCNSIIYDIVHALEKDDTVYENIEKQIICMVVDRINEYINIIKPSNTIYIAFDGVAPFAKMEQQRSRRYKSFFVNNILNKKTKWDTANITPGTDFMNTMSKVLNSYYQSNKSDFNVKNIIISASDEIGEGEHKLFSHMRQNPDMNQNTAVYGLDSDLIMLSIFHKEYFNNIYIFREAPEFLKSSIPIVFDKNRVNEPFLVDVDYLIKSILAEMDCNAYDPHRIYDYVFLCFFLGNDFLPHFPAMNIRTHGITILLELYRMYVGNLNNVYFISKEKKIKWNVVYNFIKHVSKNEHQLLLEEYDVREKWDTRYWKKDGEMEELLMNAPVIYRGEEKYIDPNETHWEDRYYKILFHEIRDYALLKQICINYLEGLEWVFKYYTSDCPDWRWKYNYHYPPLFVDLLGFIPRTEKEFICKTRPAFSNNTQLAYIFSINQHNILPKKLSEKLAKDYYEIYNDKIGFKWAFCRYFWESHVTMKNIPNQIMEEWEKINI